MEIPTDNTHEQVLSFEEQLTLANSLFQAVSERNMYVQGQGGFNTFAEAGQHVEGAREAYNNLEKAANAAREAFDAGVLDKKEFVRSARSAGNVALADLIASMFRAG